MDYDFQHTCQVEIRKVLWLIGLVLTSVLIIQCFDLSYTDSMMSLFSSGNANFSDPEADKGVNTDAGLKGKQTSYLNSSSFTDRKSLDGQSVPAEKFEKTNAVNHSVEVETKDRRISVAATEGPVKSIGQNGVADIASSAVNTGLKSENGINAASPAFSDLSPAPESATDIRYKDSEENTIADVSQSVTSNTVASDSLHAPALSQSQLAAHGNMNVVGVAANESRNGTESDLPKSESAASGEHSSIRSSSPPPTKLPESSVVSISEMNEMFLHSRSISKTPLWPSDADQVLSDARSQIEHATIIRDHPGLYAPVYRNLSTFLRSYELMEQKLKIYIYKEGKPPVFHQPRLRGIYSSEGWFMKLLKASSHYVTNNGGEAHLFYLPFSSQLLAEFVYVPNSHSFDDIRQYLRNYLNTIKSRYSYWNRTDGTDHFLVACHDWAPADTRQDMANCIRALCNADVKERFQFGKDISLPETYMESSPKPTKDIGGKPPSQRKILGFFAGKMHGYLRPILLKHWKDKDPDMKIFGQMPKKNYVWHMKNSKYCICARGYEVNSPRVVEAIMYGCVPVILSDDFVPPFFEILNWESFAVFVREDDAPNLKGILLSISERRYLVMQQRVMKVRQHFLWHNTPVKYDIFHMILHSVWYTRVFQLSSR